MNIEICRDIKVKDIINNYKNLGIDGVYALNDKLEVRPPYQRNFVYGAKEESAVIDSIIHNYPIGILYFAKKNENEYECLDGQQRIISICEFAQNNVLVNVDGAPQNYASLVERDSTIVDRFLNYEFVVAICDGTDDEKLKWFERINIVGEPLTNQELRNAIYVGPWVLDAKKYFGHSKCAAWHKTTKNYGNIFNTKLKVDRSLWLEQVIKWKCEFDGRLESNVDESIKNYMVEHRTNSDASDLIEYFENMLSWLKASFKYKDIMEKVDWGCLYNKYNNVTLNIVSTDDFIEKMLKYGKDAGVTNLEGIYEYLFDGNISHLSVRAFSDDIKRIKYDEQNHKCNNCQEEFAFDDLCGDHIVPWSKGGKTTLENCQLLCVSCNSIKTNKFTKEGKEQIEKLRINI